MGILTESKPRPQLSSHEELQDQPSSFPFSILQSSFTGDLLTPLHPSYSSSITRWAINASRSASLVAYPKSPKDVSLVMSFAQTNGMKLTVKGGGHSCMGASSVGEGGVVVDFQKYFGGVRVDEGKKLHPQRKTVFSGFLIHPLLVPVVSGMSQSHIQAKSSIETTASSNGHSATSTTEMTKGPRLNLGKIDEVFTATSEWWYRLKPGSTSSSESGEHVPGAETVFVVIQGRGQSGNGQVVQPQTSEGRANASMGTVDVDMDLDVIVIPFLNGLESAGKEIYKGFFDSAVALRRYLSESRIVGFRLQLLRIIDFIVSSAS
ncbi:hypothetical protein K435DRAFT_861720 [Dendrothele bispora CBS 962.96]|uniref:FAD-binding PCMH-type domain-containing protein n=1 Tax=Dendrothele bispora (strain CBS 962.96) TaxID=1314807 RepID=A0A4S8LUE0_DENBC|nr:hypothetical protein K435DRAFT_861720 [Dendrothele bispora CBS 962.96]